LVLSKPRSREVAKSLHHHLDHRLADRRLYPVLLMGGMVGRIFNDSAVVVTVAIVASAFVSLTLTRCWRREICADAGRREANRTEPAF